MKEIRLLAMRFQTLIGILPHERTLAQPIEIDLAVDVTDGADGADTDAIVDYRALYDIAAAVACPGPTDFLEEIGDRIASDALAYSARVRSARVAVRKMNVALPGPLAYAEVVVTRTADD
ncbi:MAG TPA: dihydroneopterin aldolase [Gemmatimonadaceae bacterium]|nr:dihydroneopterin aldolase [Gemmatimonadaceae bacterium]